MNSDTSTETTPFKQTWLKLRPVAEAFLSGAILVLACNDAGQGRAWHAVFRIALALVLGALAVRNVLRDRA